MDLFNYLLNNKQRRKISSFVDMIVNPVLPGITQVIPSNVLMRLTCVTPGGTSIVAGVTYSGLSAGQYIIIGNAEPEQTFNIHANDRLDIDVGLGVWKKVAGGS